MKPTPKSRTTAAAASTAVATTSSATATTPSSSAADCETLSRGYQAKVLGITIFGVVGIVVFIKYVTTKYFAQLEASHQQHLEF